VPAALALGWVPRPREPCRRGESQFGEFQFERLRPNRLERMGIDFRYGDRPDVWLCLAVWSGERGICTSFSSGDCSNSVPRRLGLWVLRPLYRRCQPAKRLAKVLARGHRLLGTADRYFCEGGKHPGLSMITTSAQGWPEGSGERMRSISAREADHQAEKD